MGKKGLASIFSKLVAPTPTAAAAEESPFPPWPWAPCRNPQTASSRADDYRPCSTSIAAAVRSPATAAVRLHNAGDMYKTVNSVYNLDCSADGSCFNEEEELGVLELDDDSFSMTTASEEWSEAVIRSLGQTSTDRLFFDPGPASSSLLPAASQPPAKPAPEEETEVEEPSEEQSSSTSLVEESVAVAVDSEDPYRDFRASMEEMVAAHGLRGWESLEELLVWYLRINGKHNHALIVGAFVDLLVGLASRPSSAAATATTMTATSSSSCASTSCSASTSSTSGGDTDATPTAAATEQCGGENGASCSCSSCDQLEEELAVDVDGDKASDDDISGDTASDDSSGSRVHNLDALLGAYLD